MPELPEVETVRRALATGLDGRWVLDLVAEPVMMRRPLEPQVLRRRMVGRRFVTPRRRGKFLLLGMEQGAGTLLMHLGMSGRVLLCDPRTPLESHTHLILRLDSGLHLRLIDPRRFGFASWLDPGEELCDPSLSTLGPEPLDPSISSWLPDALRTRRGPLKSLLLDQGTVAGVGNIYATEALFRAGIHPRRPGCRTSLQRLQRLADAVREVLLDAVAEGGTTLRDFSSPGGDLGYFAVRLQVYGRAGQPCPRCGRPLRNDVVAGRATVWCTRCQH